MNDGYSDYFTSLLGKTTIQITKIVFFFCLCIQFNWKFLITNSSFCDFIKKEMKMETNLMMKKKPQKPNKNVNNKHNCSGSLAFKSQRVGYHSNQKLLHHY